MSQYKDTINAMMRRLAKDGKRRFVGYNVRCGLAGGSLEGIQESQLIETPVAENLMTGVAIGLSLVGFKPVLYFERFDFVMNAMDAIVNHLDKMSRISFREFKPCVLIRIVVGNKEKPLFTGETHTGNYSDMLRSAVKFKVLESKSEAALREAYNSFLDNERTMAIVEFKDLY